MATDSAVKVGGPGWACQDCGHRFAAVVVRCSECFGWRITRRRPRLFSSVAVSSAVALARLSSALPWLDSLLGGALPRGAVLMVAGKPGTGKSTLVHQAYSGARCLWLTTEEAPGAIAARCGRLGLPLGHVVVGLDGLTVERLRRFAVLVVDSLQGFGGSWDAQAACHDRLRSLVVGSGVTAVYVSQVTQAGQAAGGPRVEHRPDVNLTVEVEGETRKVSVVKNRFGACGTVSQAFCGGKFVLEATQ